MAEYVNYFIVIEEYNQPGSVDPKFDILKF